MKYFKLLLIISILFSCSSKLVYFKKERYEGFYSHKHHQSQFVKYTIKKKDVFGTTKRTNNFKVDYKIDSTVSFNHYYKSGYDRGHLKPAGASKASLQDMKSSFLFTNISPQVPEFNRQGWKFIESKTRGVLNNYDSIIVYSGPVFKRFGNKKLADSDITIPKKFFKAIYINDSIAFGFICPNEKLNKNVFNYLVSIDEIERLIRQDLFEGLNDEVEANIDTAFITGVVFRKEIKKPHSN